MAQQVGDIDYQTKLRDLCCINLAALAHTENSVLRQIVKNRQAKLTPFFEGYVNDNGYAKLDGLANNCAKSALHPILNFRQESNNNTN